MSSDLFEQAKRKAQLQKQENQLTQQEQQLRNDISENKAQTDKLQNRNKELDGKFQSFNPDKATEEQAKQFNQDTQEHKGNVSKIQKNQQELTQKQQQLKEFQLKEQAKVQGDKIKNQGAERGHERYAVSPDATGTKKGDIKRQYHQTQANSYPPKKMEMSDAKDIKNMNHEKQRSNSSLYDQAKDKGKENKDNPQQQTQAKQNEQDNER